MTGYNRAHGDTGAVQLDLINDYTAYKTYMTLIHTHTTWTDGAWSGVQDAVQVVETYVRQLEGHSGHKPEYGEIRDADLDAVDWQKIVLDVLHETNLQAGRDYDAGLP